MRRIKITIQYDGTDFVGWQRQLSGASIQAHIEEALANMTDSAHTGIEPFVRGAGRTDSGVHAIAQVAHFDTEANIPLFAFRRGLNSALPRSISIVGIEEVTPDFDARFSAHNKLYRYQIWNSESRASLIDRYSWHILAHLDLDKMREAAAALLGTHDFYSFRAADCQRKTTVRTLTRFDINKVDDLITFEVEGNAFLKHMVRILVGTLSEIGRARRPVSDIARIFAARNRTEAGQTAPAKGLTLVRVDYPKV